MEQPEARPPVNGLNHFLDDEVITNYPSFRRKSTLIASSDDGGASSRYTICIRYAQLHHIFSIFLGEAVMPLVRFRSHRRHLMS